MNSILIKLFLDRLYIVFYRVKEHFTHRCVECETLENVYLCIYFSAWRVLYRTLLHIKRRVYIIWSWQLHFVAYKIRHLPFSHSYLLKLLLIIANKSEFVTLTATKKSSFRFYVSFKSKLNHLKLETSLYYR